MQQKNKRILKTSVKAKQAFFCPSTLIFDTITLTLCSTAFLEFLVFTCNKVFLNFFLLSDIRIYLRLMFYNKTFLTQ